MLPHSTALLCRVKGLRTCCHTARHCNVGLKACAHVATHTTLICRVKGLRTCCHTARHCYVGLKACAHVATHTTLICRVKVLRTCYQQHGRHAHTLCWNANVHRMGSRHEVQGYTFGTVRQIKLLPQQSEKRLSTSKTVIWGVIQSRVKPLEQRRGTAFLINGNSPFSPAFLLQLLTDWTAITRTHTYTH